MSGPSTLQAQDSKSADIVKQLTQLLDAKKLDSIAAPDPQSPGTYVAALYFSGSQLLVVSAKYAAPALLNDKISKKDYREVYIDLSSASVAGSKLFVIDTNADGLNSKPGDDQPFDTVDRGNVAVLVRWQLEESQDDRDGLHESVRRDRQVRTRTRSRC